MKSVHEFQGQLLPATHFCKRHTVNVIGKQIYRKLIHRNINIYILKTNPNGSGGIYREGRKICSSMDLEKVYNKFGREALCNVLKMYGVGGLLLKRNNIVFEN